MKKIIFLFALLYLLIGATCCNKEEDVVSPIAGTYTYTFSGSQDCDETWYNYLAEHICDDFSCSKFYFTEHTNRFTEEYVNGTTRTQLHGDFSITGGKLKRCWDDASIGCITTDFSLVDGTLTLSQPGGDHGCTHVDIYDKD